MTDFKKYLTVLLATMFLTAVATVLVMAEPDGGTSGTGSQTGSESTSDVSDTSDDSSVESGSETESGTESGDSGSSDESGGSDVSDSSGGGDQSDITDSSDETDSSDTETSSEYEPASQNMNPSWNEYESERSTGNGSRIVIPSDPVYDGRVNSGWTTNDRSDAGQTTASDVSSAATTTITSSSASKNLFDLKGKFKRWIVLPATVALLSGAALIAVNLNYSKSNGQNGQNGKSGNGKRNTASGPKRPRD